MKRETNGERSRKDGVGSVHAADSAGEPVRPVGEARDHGERLVDVTEKRSRASSLVRCGGLHAQVLEGGRVRVGDEAGEAG